MQTIHETIFQFLISIFKRFSSNLKLHQKYLFIVRIFLHTNCSILRFSLSKFFQFIIREALKILQKTVALHTIICYHLNVVRWIKAFAGMERKVSVKTIERKFITVTFERQNESFSILRYKKFELLKLQK